MQEMQVGPLGWKDPPEREVAADSSILAWEIPWTEEPEDCSPWGCKESDMTQRLNNSKDIQAKYEHYFQ